MYDVSCAKGAAETFMKKKSDAETETEYFPEKEGASSRHLDKEYIGSYRRWRRENKGKYGFFYRNIKNEFSYEDGRGFIKDIPEYAEVSTLSRVNSTICNILTVFLLFKVFTDYILPLILANRFGIYIGMNYNAKKLYGDGESVIIYEYITKIIGRLVPLIMLAIVTKMPFSIMFPAKISNKPLFRLCVPAALLVASLGSVMMVPYRMMLEVFHVNNDMNLLVTDNMTVQIMSVILSLFINSVLSELIVHGGFFQLLRQFGDGYALVISGIILALNSEDIRIFPFYFIIGVSTGYFALRTGSILTAITMRITIHFYFYMQSFCAAFPDEDKSAAATLIFMTLCMLTGLVFIVYYMIKNNNKISLPMKDTYLTSYEKAMEFLTNPSVIMWIATGVSIMIITIPVEV